MCCYCGSRFASYDDMPDGSVCYKNAAACGTCLEKNENADHLAYIAEEEEEIAVRIKAGRMKELREEELWTIV